MVRSLLHVTFSTSVVFLLRSWALALPRPANFAFLGLIVLVLVCCCGCCCYFVYKKKKEITGIRDTKDNVGADDSDEEFEEDEEDAQDASKAPATKSKSS